MEEREAVFASCEATVKADGIWFLDSCFTCRTAIREQWYEQARLQGEWSVIVLYDPKTDRPDMIYIVGGGEEHPDWIGYQVRQPRLTKEVEIYQRLFRKLLDERRVRKNMV